jgi:hypothetical protein
MFLAVAAGAGFAAGRLFRGAKADAEGSTPSSGNGTSAADAGPAGIAGSSGVVSTGSSGAGRTAGLPAADLDPLVDERARVAEVGGGPAGDAAPGGAR